MSTSLLTVPTSIEAKTRDELTMLMLVVQSRLKAKVHFFDIQFEQGKWIAWYEVNLEATLVKNK